jgi:hypothetical protein
MYRYPTNLNKMPDASTQTTKGKKIFLLPKKKGFGETTIQLCWSCDLCPATHRTYRDALDDYELTCDECHKDEYPEEYKVGFLCKNQDCSAVKTDEYNERCQICDGYFMDDGLNDILFIDEEPNRKHTQKKGTGCHLCGYADEGVVRLKKTGEYICQDACPDSDDEDEEKCCKCGTDEEVHSCWECDQYFCIECDGNEMATYGKECHTYCEDCGEKVEERESPPMTEKEEERRQIMSDFKRVAEERIKEQFGSLSGFKVSCNF